MIDILLRTIIQTPHVAETGTPTTAVLQEEDLEQIPMTGFLHLRLSKTIHPLPNTTTTPFLQPEPLGGEHTIPKSATLTLSFFRPTTAAPCKIQ